MIRRGLGGAVHRPAGEGIIGTVHRDRSGHAALRHVKGKLRGVVINRLRIGGGHLCAAGIVPVEGGRCRTAEDGVEGIVVVIDGNGARGLRAAGGGGGAVPTHKGPRTRGGIRFACRLARLQRIAGVGAAGIGVRYRNGAGGCGGTTVGRHVEVDL